MNHHLKVLCSAIRSIDASKYVARAFVLLIAAFGFSAGIAGCESDNNQAGASPAAASMQEKPDHPEHPTDADQPVKASDSDHPEHPSDSDHPEHPADSDHPDS